jgi:hypothetical protein
MTHRFKAIAEKTGSLLDLKPTGRWYVGEEGEHETFKALAFCDAEGRVNFFDSEAAAHDAIDRHIALVERNPQFDSN